jgi:hypothetical protein
MEDGKSAMYQRAIATGILDGFARHFASELRAFKGVYRVEEEAARLLVEWVGQVGGFIL